MNVREWWFDHGPYVPWREAISGFFWEFRHPPLWIAWTPPWRRHHKACDERFRQASMDLMGGGDPDEFKRNTGGIMYCSTCDYMDLSPTKKRMIFWLVVTRSSWDNARAFLGGLGDHEAELLTASEVCKLSKGALATKYTIAGTINGFVHPCESVGYALPFLPFQRFGEETSYAIRQSVADAFNKVRRA